MNNASLLDSSLWSGAINRALNKALLLMLSLWEGEGEGSKTSTVVHSLLADVIGFTDPEGNTY